MFNKTLLATLMVGVSACAADAPANGSFSGFNVGAHFGMGTGKSDVNRQYLLAPRKSDSVDLGTAGALGGLNVGYGNIYQGWYLGLQAGGELANVKGDINTHQTAFINHKASLKMKRSYQVSARVGKAMNNVLPYFKLGSAFSKWEVKSSNFQAPINARTSKHRPALIVGGGADFLVTKQLSLGAEYLYSHYKSVTLNHPKSAKYTIKPRLHTVTLNLRWHFN